MKPRSPDCLFFLFLFIVTLRAVACVGAAEITPPASPTPGNPASSPQAISADTGDAAPANATQTTPTPLPSNTPSTPEASTATAANSSQTQLISRDLPEIHAKILLPRDWTLIPGKLLEGDVLLATREKITGENDPWTTGLSMSIDRNGAKDSGQKASDYAMTLAREAHEKAGDEATPLKESQSGAFHEIRFDFPIAGDQPLLMTEVLRANDATGTLVVILWQSSKEESSKLQSLKESILAGLKLDPTR